MKQQKFKLIGLLFIISAIILNKYFVGKILTGDGTIESLPVEIIIWSFDIVCIIYGILLVVFTEKTKFVTQSVFKKLKPAIIIFIITITLFYILDLLTGLVWPIQPWETQEEITAKLSYEGEPYYSKEFLLEKHEAIEPGQWETPKNSSMILKTEYSGKYINAVKESFGAKSVYRKTTNKYSYDDKDVKKILILGGSTIYCNEVPDELTISSKLSKKLNTGNDKFFVINAGMDSANSKQELERIEYELENGLTPDIVISYHGYNDIVTGIYQKNPDGVMFYRNRLKETIFKILPLNIYKRIRHETEKNKEDIRINPTEEDPDELKQLKFDTKETYLKNSRRINELSKKYNFEYYDILQPIAIYGDYPDSNKDIQEVYKYANKYLPGSFEATKHGYEVLQEAVSILDNEGISSFNWSKLLINKNENIFVDPCHINSKGNEIIASELYKMLIKTK
ncbi:MAG: hypothetical protein ABF289_16670 [Clostridiales bacterium]